MRATHRGPSSREMRRRAERDMKRKRPSQPRREPLAPTMLVRMQYVLAPLEQIVDDIERTGSVMAAGREPVFTLPHESAAHLYPIVPAIDGIVDFYEMFCIRRKRNETLPGIRQFARRLEYGMPVSEREIAAVRQDMRTMRKIVPGLSSQEAADLLLQTQIMAEMEARSHVPNQTTDQPVA